ncbi:MAG: prepilin-type N-terminal cleavage/methylation domain-containing protein [Desulfobulbaceae bacterium]|nr:prepilin-type N-terminal cleavage/methylation domain-containing protein [Desulfobulbaceae bacterium]
MISHPTFSPLPRSDFRRIRDKKGFTAIEILLAIIIIGLMVIVMVPRGQRATTEARYGIVRQNCTQLAGFAVDWIERMMLAQDDNSASTRIDYLNSLATCNLDTPDFSSTIGAKGGVWIATSNINNWNNNSRLTRVKNRMINKEGPASPEISVQGIIKSDQALTNPFNQLSVFGTGNYSPSSVTPGAIAAGGATADTTTSVPWAYFALVFQGTDNQNGARYPNNGVDFHAGMATTSLQGLKNGIFLARERLER